MKYPKGQGTASPGADSRERSAVVQALLSPNSDASTALVRRTRYAVRDSAISMEEQKVRQRHSTGLALSVLFTVLILLTPEIWSGVVDLLAGEHFANLPCQLALLLLMVAPAMLAALAVIGREHWKNRHDRNDF